MAQLVVYFGAVAVIAGSIVSSVAQIAAPATVPPRLADMKGIYGALPRTVSAESAGRIASFLDGKLNRDFQEVSAAEARGFTPVPVRRGKKRTRSLDLKQMTSSLDKMGISIDGVVPPTADLLDGPLTQEGDHASVSAGTSPSAFAFASPSRMSSAVRRQPKAVDAKGALDAPSGDHADLFADPNPSGAPVAPLRTPPLHPKIYDVSEGTKLDPLKNHNYDLNSGKDIPAELLSK